MKKKSLFLLIVSISIILLSILIFVFYIRFFFSFVSNEGTKRTNQEIIEYFYKNEDSLVDLNTELLYFTKNGLYRIDDNWTKPDDLSEIGMNNKKLKYFRNIFNSIDMPRGIISDGKSITYILHTYGLSVSGGSEGLIYTIDEPKNYFKDNGNIQLHPFETVDEVDYPEKGSYTIYIKIKENWYIYNDYED